MAQTVTKTMNVQSPAFPAGQPIPRKYTEDGDNLSPPLAWSGVPEQAKELALVVDDPDAPTPQPWVHWILAKIPPEMSALGEGFSCGRKYHSPACGIDGINSWGSPGYRGPAPPRGHGTHHYHFRLYALSEPLNVTGQLDKKALLAAMQGKILAHAKVVGTYERK